MTYRHLLITTAFSFAAAGLLHAESREFINAGKSQAVRAQGTLWETGSGYGTGDGYLQCSGQQNFLFGESLVGAGDFTIRARLSIDPLEKTGASFELGSSQFGFDGPTNGQLWIKRGEEKMNTSVRRINLSRPGKPSPLRLFGRATSCG